MQAFIGTSGFSYPEWRGTFYPEGLPPKAMLSFYSRKLTSVEINNTFYRMPKADVVDAWYSQVPEGFRFVVKASRRITHQQRLVEASDSVAYLMKTAEHLREKLGPILFQLPPFLRKDVGVLAAFLEVLPANVKAAFEFRHPSWFSDDVFDALKARGASLVCGDPEDDAKSPPLVATAPWGYLRWRKPEYSSADLEDWAKRLEAQGFTEVFGYFKHEIQGPALAASLNRLLGVEPPAGSQSEN